MKVLYAAYRHDPSDLKDTIGADSSFFNALRQHTEYIQTTEPVKGEPVFAERALRSFYRRFSPNHYAKYPISYAWRASQNVNELVRTWKPDVVFTLYPPALAFYRGTAPCILRTDTPFFGMYQQGKKFLRHDLFGLSICVWQEKRAFSRSQRIITHSEWAKCVLVESYRLDKKKVDVFPNPASLAYVHRNQVVNLLIDSNRPVELLFVGSDVPRKGVEPAIEITRQLNNRGYPANLTICGFEGKNQSHVRYVGRFDKNDLWQYAQYIKCFQSSHFLLHPTLFDPSPRVTAEAAAFGVPTITNDVGGMAASVKHGESGIVLPAHSPPERYVETVISFLQQPDRYLDLRRKTRARYERELNWEVVGKQIAEICTSVATETLH